MIDKACKQIELIFWEVFIFTLSNSKSVRNMVIYSSGFVHELKQTRTLWMMGLATVLGLISGFLLCLIKINLP